MALPTKELIETGWLRDALTRALDDGGTVLTPVQQFVANVRNSGSPTINFGNGPKPVDQDEIVIRYSDMKIVEVE